MGGASLLAQTRSRVASTILPQRTVFTLVKSHERFYCTELWDVQPSRLVIQPSNKGTTAAIAYSLLRIVRMDAEALVGFFPTDHFYAREQTFVSAVDRAFRVVREQPSLIILLGAQPDRGDGGYGWIRPAGCCYKLGNQLFRVGSFWEKPSPGVAQLLLNCGSLWNTFVMIGRAQVFLEILAATVPDVLAALDFVSKEHDMDTERERAKSCYDQLPSSDFSSEVLQKCTDRLLVLRLGATGWSDLGTEDRVQDAMQRAGTTPVWMAATP